MSEMRKLTDVIGTNMNKSLKFYKCYILKDFMTMDLAIDGDIVYPTELAAIKAAFKTAYKNKSEEFMSEFFNLGDIDDTSVFKVQGIMIKIPREKFDVDNCILGDDDGIYIRLKDFEDRKIAYCEYSVTNFAAAKDDDDNLIIKTMDFKETTNNIKVDIEAF